MKKSISIFDIKFVKKIFSWKTTHSIYIYFKKSSVYFEYFALGSVMFSESANVSIQLTIIGQDLFYYSGYLITPFCFAHLRISNIIFDCWRGCGQGILHYYSSTAAVAVVKGILWADLRFLLLRPRVIHIKASLYREIYSVLLGLDLLFSSLHFTSLRVWLQLNMRPCTVRSRSAAFLVSVRPPLSHITSVGRRVASLRFAWAQTVTAAAFDFFSPHTFCPHCF